MANKNTEKKLKKTIGFFTLIGKAKVNDNTYSKDIISEKSGFKYSRLNLGVETEKGNIVYASAMAGYFPGGKDIKGKERKNIIYVNSKEDFMTQFQIDFADRQNKEILKTVHENNFIKIGLEKYDNEGKQKIYIKKFLSWYDAIPYLEEHLKDDTIINVKGNLSVNYFNDEVQIQKDITSIFLSSATEDKFKSNFVMDILLEDDSIGELDKDEMEIPIKAKIIDYLKEYNGIEIRKNVPFIKDFYLEVRKDKPEITKKMIKKFFKVKEGVRQIQVEGKFIEGLKTSEVSENDLSQDMLDLIDMGIYEKDELLNKMATNGDRIHKMYITKPYVKRTKDEDGKISLNFSIKDNAYTPEELIPFYLQYDEEIQELENEDEEDINNELETDIENDEVDTDLEDFLNDI